MIEHDDAAITRRLPAVAVDIIPIREVVRLRAMRSVVDDNIAAKRRRVVVIVIRNIAMSDVTVREHTQVHVRECVRSVVGDPVGEPDEVVIVLVAELIALLAHRQVHRNVRRIDGGHRRVVVAKAAHEHLIRDGSKVFIAAPVEVVVEAVQRIFVDHAVPIIVGAGGRNAVASHGGKRRPVDDVARVRRRTKLGLESGRGHCRNAVDKRAHPDAGDVQVFDARARRPFGRGRVRERTAGSRSRTDRAPVRCVHAEIADVVNGRAVEDQDPAGKVPVLGDRQRLMRGANGGRNGYKGGAGQERDWNERSVRAGH